MEDVLEVYHLPYDSDYPVVCMDESSKQLIGEFRNPIPCKPGQPERVDDEYIRNGVVEIFMEVEPLGGQETCCHHGTPNQKGLGVADQADA